ncbi:hypothetical protein [Tropicibacter sp. Alg240-R139]
MTAILINAPGSPAASCTVFDGYLMARMRPTIRPMMSAPC